MKNTHHSHEIRLSTPDDWRTRGIVGAYWEDFEIYDDMNFLYRTIPSCTPENLADRTRGRRALRRQRRSASGHVRVGSRACATTTPHSARTSQRGYKQTAVFTSIDYDIIPKVLTITGGTRYYRYSEYEVGSKYTHPLVAPTCRTAAMHGRRPTSTPKTENTTYTGFKSRGNLTWHITPDVMVYYTFSQGFRPGGFNRSQSRTRRI